jgi:tetratricopeptide (TPR) repeat protein
MPSLQALRDFKTSFQNIGGEISARAEQNIPFDDLALPDYEPPAPTEAVPEPPPSGDDPDFSGDFFPDFSGETGEPDFSFDDLNDAALNLDEIPGGDDSPGENLPAGDAPPGEIPAGDDADLLALLDAIPDDLGQPEEAPAPESGAEPEIPLEDAEDLSAGLADLEQGGAAEVPPEPEAAEAAGADDFRLPDGLLDGLADDLAESPSGDAGETDDLLADFEDLGGEAPAEAPSEDLGGEFSPDNPGIEAPAEAAGMEDFSIPDMDLGDETLTEDLGEELAVEDLGGEPAAEDLGGEMPGESFAADSFDSFNLDGDALGSDGTGETAAVGGEVENLDEFALPGIDDVFAEGVPGLRDRAGLADSAAGETPEEVEEIQLSDEDLARFQKTLLGYPLNLRIACEELVAEQAVAPDLMSRLVKLLIRGAPAREAAALAGKILGRTIPIPRGFEKNTGEALEAEQASFAYIFIHKFLPVLRIFLLAAIAAASLFYLIFQFIYTPARAESFYKMGYERIFAGEYQRANDRFSQAFEIHRNKKWFYRYAEAFRDERQYIYAEQKYDELLNFYPRDKQGVLDYAAMETGYQRNYAKADELLRRNILDYAPDDKDALLALGDNSLAWGEIDKSKYEDARFAYARLLDKYGWTDPVVERMMLYFIRTDNLKEVLPLQAYFMENKRRKISAASLAELGGYLLDKRMEEARGVPNEYVERIEGIRDLLLRAVAADPALPESHYHLARYYHNLNNAAEERVTLENALRAFDAAPEGSIRRIVCRIDAQKRYADILINNREFFPAEEQLVKGIGIYEDAFSRRLLSRSPEFGKLYAGLGDLEYFTKTGNMDMVLQYYRRSEQHGWAPPEVRYRMGSAYYHLEEWRDALEQFFAASADLPLNRRLLYALGNVSYQRRDYFTAQGYYNRLLDILEVERSRLPLLLPNDQPEFIELAERLMIARNNMGAVYEALAQQTGDNHYRSRALALYSESARAWDSLTRNPQTMVRSLPMPGIFGPGVNLPYLNSRNILYPQPGYEPQIFLPIDKDVLEPSAWERLAPQGSRLSE